MWREGRHGDINNHLPTFFGEGAEEEESTISAKVDTNTQCQELVQKGKSETKNGQCEGEIRSFRGRDGEAAISIIWGGAGMWKYHPAPKCRFRR